MFNLIITIISIALVAVLAVATIYYGGSVFSQQGKEVDTAKLLNASAHLKGAIEMYRNDHAGTPPATLSALMPQYLKAIPEGAMESPWTVVNGFAITTIGPSVVGGAVTQANVDSARAACEAVNVKLGITGPVQLCSAVSSNIQVCCDNGL